MIKSLAITSLSPGTISTNSNSTISISTGVVGDMVAFVQNPLCVGAQANALVIESGSVITIPPKFLSEGAYYACYSTNAAQSDSDYFVISSHQLYVISDSCKYSSLYSQFWLDVISLQPSTIQSSYSYPHTIISSKGIPESGTAALIPSPATGCTGAYPYCFLKE